MATPTLYPAYYDKANSILIYQDLGTTVEVPVGGDVVIPEDSYASNDDAVAALGDGVLYKSTTLINGSPIILITV